MRSAPKARVPAAFTDYGEPREQRAKREGHSADDETTDDEMYLHRIFEPYRHVQCPKKYAVAL